MMPSPRYLFTFPRFRRMMSVMDDRYSLSRKTRSSGSSFSEIVVNPATSEKKTVSSFFSPPSLMLSRSEEHTSELQSHHDLVCRLLLEKKKTTRPSAGSVRPSSSTSTLIQGYTFSPAQLSRTVASLVVPLCPSQRTPPSTVFYVTRDSC